MNLRRLLPSPTIVTGVALGLAGCGAGAAEPDRAELTVSAAASLAGPMERYARAFEPARVRLSLGGSDELAAQIRRGARPDLYAAANTALPAQLHGEGLVERPTVFATNRLVVAVPARSAIDSVSDLERPGVRLVIGSPSVPVGAYARRALGRVGPERSRRVLANVRSEEPDVKAVVAKVAHEAADAGFAYRTDVGASGGRLRGVELPDRLRPEAAYAVAVVRGARHARLARRFAAGMRSGRGAQLLRKAGFGPPSPRR